MIRILVVNEHSERCALVASMIARGDGYQVVSTMQRHDTLTQLQHATFDVVLADTQTLRATGMELLHQITQSGAGVPVIMVTDEAGLEAAMEAVQAGATDFITLPTTTTFLHYRLQHVLRQARIRQLAYTDGLTGLANRHSLQERLASEVERANRYHRPLAALMLDIDHFKLYNDTYGHLQGDTVLREIAHVLQQGSRTSDTVARYGGDEFTLLLPETDRAHALRLAQRLRAQVAQHDFFGVEHLPGGTLTLSVGVAAHVDAGTAETLLQAADAALYAAKRIGGNQVQVAWQSVPDQHCPARLAQAGAQPRHPAPTCQRYG